MLRAFMCYFRFCSASSAEQVHAHYQAGFPIKQPCAHSTGYTVTGIQQRDFPDLLSGVYPIIAELRVYTFRVK